MSSPLHLDAIRLAYDTPRGPHTVVDGFSLAHWIRKARPDLKVLLTSGVRRAAETAGDLCEEGPHLAKPYAHRDLESQIRRLLAR